MEPNLVPPPETSRDEVEIAQDSAISINEALTVAASVPFPIGKSTLQRWAKHWATQGAASPVKCVLVTNWLGASYRIDRGDFEAWAFEQAQNGRPLEIPQDLRDLKRPNKTP